MLLINFLLSFLGLELSFKVQPIYRTVCENSIKLVKIMLEESYLDDVDQNWSDFSNTWGNNYQIYLNS